MALGFVWNGIVTPGKKGREKGRPSLFFVLMTMNDFMMVSHELTNEEGR